MFANPLKEHFQFLGGKRKYAGKAILLQEGIVRAHLKFRGNQFSVDPQRC